MKRVLIFSLQYYPLAGGAEVAIKEITDRIAPEDIEFDMVTLQFDSSAPRSERIGSVIVHRVGWGRKGLTYQQSFSPLFYISKALFVPLAAIRGLQLLRTRHYAAAWAMMSYMVFPLALMRAAGAHLPYLLTLQEGDPFEHVFERWHIRLVSPLLRSGIRHAAAIQAISTFLAGWVRECGYEGKLEVIPNGVDLARFTRDFSVDDLAEERAKLGKKDGETWLITTSRLVEKNAVDDVIRALAQLPEHVHFAIFGDGPLETELKRLAGELGVAARTHFFGTLAHEDLPRALKACDIFVRPSRSEGLGISFIEAMAAGLPVIATQEGGISDFLFDAKRDPDTQATGWAVDKDSPAQIAEAVTDIAEHPEHAKEVTIQARLRVEKKYGWNLIARRMQDLFVTVASLERPVIAGENTSRMKLVIATPLYPPEPGGPATYAKILEEALPALGDTVQLVKFSDVRHLPKVIRHIVYFYKVLLAGRHAEVILSLDALSVGWPTVFANFFLRKKLVIKMVGDHIWEQGTQRFRIEGSLDDVSLYSLGWHPYLTFLRVLQQISMRAATRVIVPSEYLKTIVLRWGIPERKVTVIYNAVDIGAVTPVAYDGPRPLIVSVGRLVPWKGFEGLIDAVVRLREKIPTIALQIIGDGPERIRLEAFAASTGHGDAVTFVGAKPHDETLEIMKAADVFVLNSSYEGLSHTLIEALLLGCAIVSSDAGGNPELIRNEENGLSVSVGDTDRLAAAVETLLSDDALRARLKARAVETSARFSLDIMLTRTSELLQSLAPQARHSSDSPSV